MTNLLLHNTNVYLRKIITNFICFILYMLLSFFDQILDHHLI